ncbi:MAG: hypothetical protein ABSF65_08420 [Candidatus Bathyarchaeia archaeon]|jgi:hypothetical protein
MRHPHVEDIASLDYIKRCRVRTGPKNDGHMTPTVKRKLPTKHLVNIEKHLSFRNLKNGQTDLRKPQYRKPKNPQLLISFALPETLTYLQELS